MIKSNLFDVYFTTEAKRKTFDDLLSLKQIKEWVDYGDDLDDIIYFIENFFSEWQYFIYHESDDFYKEEDKINKDYKFGKDFYNSIKKTVETFRSFDYN